ncbi:MAG: gamma-glutamyl-gamma-aminobutyrate hydrolase family protein [Pseudohongiellaceae bacterium]
MIRLAILDCDILYPELQPQWHSYGEMFRRLLGEAGVDWDMRLYTVINGEYPASPDEADAFLITGSKYDAFADEDWVRRLREYVRTLYAQGKPLIGICFGHQLLAHALGGEAARSDKGWGLGVMRYELQERPGFIDEGDAVRLIASHRDQVRRLPADARLLLSNAFCPLAGFHVPGRLLALQGHPEFTARYAQDLLDCRKDRLPAATVTAARRTLVAEEAEGIRVGRWIRRFVVGCVESFGRSPP